MTCKHQMVLANQGIHWCELQKPCYPNCDYCLSWQKIPDSTIATNATTKVDLDVINNKTGDWSKPVR